jgi:hypothetical protein
MTVKNRGTVAKRSHQASCSPNMMNIGKAFSQSSDTIGKTIGDMYRRRHQNDPDVESNAAVAEGVAQVVTGLVGALLQMMSGCSPKPRS